MPPQARKRVANDNPLLIAKLAESNLEDSALIKKLRYRFTPADQCPPDLPYAAAGFVIPYFDLAGKETKFWRYRYLDKPKQTGFDALTERKWLRYVQPSKTVNEVYLPPLLPWRKVAENPSVPLIITEGELKAACACAYTKTPTMGLGGVWCFKSGNNHMPLLPIFKEFKWQGRLVYVVYDSDAATNPKVVQAQNALAYELTKLGAEPHIGKLTGANGKKVGLDDFIVAGGSVEELLKEAEPWRKAQELHKLNEEVVYVRDPGLVLRLDTLQRMSPAAFVQHAYSTRIYYEEVETPKGTKLEERCAPKEWLRWPARSEVGKIAYIPGGDRIVNGELNVWGGWGCEPKKGDVTPWKNLLDHMFGADKAARTWFERWCAYPLQNPGVKMYTSAVIWGLVHGTGKSFIGYSLFKIYGTNATEIKDHNLAETHNEWAENKQFVMGDEITGGDKRGTSDRLKGIITQERMRINVKYIPSYELPDRINYYFTSNHPDSFFIEDRDRRYFVHEVTSDPLPDAFYRNYEEWIGSPHTVGPGAGALFHHLLTLDLGDFNAKSRAPMTDSKADMISTGRSDIGTWVATLRESPDSVLRMDKVVSKFALWRSEDLLALYDPDLKGKVTANGLARELRRQGFRKVARGHGVYTQAAGQVRLWLVRPAPGLNINDGKACGAYYDAERNIKPVQQPSQKWKGKK